jgi:hypothetical protein
VTAAGLVAILCVGVMGFAIQRGATSASASRSLAKIRLPILTAQAPART